MDMLQFTSAYFCHFSSLAGRSFYTEAYSTLAAMVRCDVIRVPHTQICDVAKFADGVRTGGPGVLSHPFPIK